MQEEPVSVKEAAAFIVRMIRPFYFGIAVMIIVSIGWAIDLSLRPYVMKLILNRVGETDPAFIFDALWTLVLIYLGLSFIHTNLFRLYGYGVEIKMIPALRRRIADTVVAYLVEHSHRYYQNHFAGSLATKQNDLVSNVPELLQIIFDRFLAFFLGVTIAIYALWQVAPQFGLSMLIWVMLFISLSILCSKKLVFLSDTLSELGSKISGRIVDTLSNIHSIRLFAQKRQEKIRLHQEFTKALDAETKMQWAYFWIFIFYGYSFVALQAITFFLLMHQREKGALSVGDFALVLIINISIVDFLWVVTQDFSHFARLMGKVTQALRILKAPIEITDKKDAKPLAITAGKIEFKAVCFQYEDADPLFQKKSVIIEPGQKVGLVGFSGSGKTTFVHLILRLFDVQQGSICIDDQNIANVTQASLHQGIGMIPQDPFLFHRSLMENIRYGRIDASDAEVIEAAKKAHAHAFIEKLPQAYDSLVGERGIKLSGGQRQRIAIARAILKNAPLLILDEATSQLDSVTERDIQASLWALMQNKTTLVIAHRLSTLLNMDRILVFDKGVIVEDGTHDALILKASLYKKLWQAQVNGFLPDDLKL